MQIVFRLGCHFLFIICTVSVVHAGENMIIKFKAGLHYQSFCDHSGNFALVNLKDL